VNGGGEHCSIVGGQDFQPGRDIGCMIFPGFDGKLQIVREAKTRSTAEIPPVCAESPETGKRQATKGVMDEPLTSVQCCS